MSALGSIGSAEALGSVLVIAKQPLPGRVKTRLTPPYSPEQAAELAAAALRDTLRAAAAIPADQHVLVFDGDPSGWIPAGWRVEAQCEGDLDARLVAAFAGVADRGPAVLVGMDTPQFAAAQVAQFAPRRFDACLGRAADGGFWVIGFADPGNAAAAISGIAMSRRDTGDRQVGRLVALELSVQGLDELTDVDDAESAALVASLAPQSEFAHVRAQMHPVGSVASNPSYASAE